MFTRLGSIAAPTPAHVLEGTLPEVTSPLRRWAWAAPS